MSGFVAARDGVGLIVHLDGGRVLAIVDGNTGQEQVAAWLCRQRVEHPDLIAAMFFRSADTEEEGSWATDGRSLAG